MRASNVAKFGLGAAILVMLAYLAIWLVCILTGQKAEFPEEG